MNYSKKDLENFNKIIDRSKVIVMLQPERIDADSLGSALALGSMLEDLGKKIVHYCIEKVPDYLKFNAGWERVTQDLPDAFSAIILVDTGSKEQLSKTFNTHGDRLLAKPFVVIDHHANRTSINDKALELVDGTAGATGQQIVDLANHFKWPISKENATLLASAILSDTLGLSTPTTTSNSFRIMAQLVDAGLDVEKLRIDREQFGAMPVEHLKLKVKLLDRVQFFHANDIAVSYASEQEVQGLNTDLGVFDDVKQSLRRLKDVKVAALISQRQDGYKVSMRANVGVAGKVATEFGGGGHDKAAGCVLRVKTMKEAIKTISDALSRELDNLNTDEAI